jgi:aspartate kinase
MEELNKAVDKMDKIVKRVGAKGVIYNRDIAKVSVVGVGMKSHSGVAAKLFEALATEKVNIDMISTSEIKISCVINKKHAKKAVRAIHKAFKLGKK